MGRVRSLSELDQGTRKKGNTRASKARAGG